MPLRLEDISSNYSVDALDADRHKLRQRQQGVDKLTSTPLGDYSPMYWLMSADPYASAISQVPDIGHRKRHVRRE